jgi:competence protein ComEA
VTLIDDPGKEVPDMPNNAVERFKSFIEDVFRDRKTLIKILSIVLILFTALVFRMHYSAAESTTVDVADGEAAVSEKESETDDSLEVSKEIYIDIGGAVKKPGVYGVKPETRLYELIEMAGGLRDDADTNSVNQAAFVEDGQKIIIPVRSESPDAVEGGSIPDNSVSSGSNTDVSSSGFVNINTAGKDELMTLNGIGDVLADRIIEYRKSSIFKKKEDIMSVNGIGASKFDKIKDQIII